MLVAGTASGLDDRDFPFANKAPGVLVYATFLDNVLRADFVREPSWGFVFEWAFFGVLCAAVRLAAAAAAHPRAARRRAARWPCWWSARRPSCTSCRASGCAASTPCWRSSAPLALVVAKRLTASEKADARRPRGEAGEPEAAGPELPGEGHARHGARHVRQAAHDRRHEARLRQPGPRLREPRPARQGLHRVQEGLRRRPALRERRRADREAACGQAPAPAPYVPPTVIPTAMPQSIPLQSVPTHAVAAQAGQVPTRVSRRGPDRDGAGSRHARSVLPRARSRSRPPGRLAGRRRWPRWRASA